MENIATLQQVDPVIARLIEAETRRQEDGLELIASENFVSPAVMEAVGTTLTNKYAEGYPGKRYYGGCEEVDKVEQLAIDRAMQLFGAQAANVQPHSGSQANMAAYMALMKVGDKWEIVIPSKLGYGEAGTPDGSIGPNQTLVFEVELKKVTPPRLRPSDPNNPDDKHAGDDMGPDDGK